MPLTSGRLRERDRLDSRHHVEHRTSCRRTAPVVPLHLRARPGSRSRLAADRRGHRRVQRRPPRRRRRPAAARRAPPVERSARRGSTHRACPPRGRPPRTHPARASPHQAHVRRLSRPGRCAPRAPAGRADGAAAPARTGLPDPPAVAPLGVPEEVRVADVPLTTRWSRLPRPGCSAAPDSRRDAAPRSRDGRRPSIGVAGGVLRGGVRAGDGRRVSRGRQLPADAEAPPVPRAGVRGGRAGASCPSRCCLRLCRSRPRPSARRPLRRRDRSLHRRRSWPRARAGATAPSRDRRRARSRPSRPGGAAASPARTARAARSRHRQGGAARRSAAPTGAGASARHCGCRQPEPLAKAAHRRRSISLPSRPCSPIPRATRPTSSRR